MTYDSVALSVDFSLFYFWPFPCVRTSSIPDLVYFERVLARERKSNMYKLLLLTIIIHINDVHLRNRNGLNHADTIERSK
jgi:hypothetical protein